MHTNNTLDYVKINSEKLSPQISSLPKNKKKSLLNADGDDDEYERIDRVYVRNEFGCVYRRRKTCTNNNTVRINVSHQTELHVL